MLNPKLSIIILLAFIPAAHSQPAPLKLVADIPLPGPAVRFDYQSLDPAHSRLYISHMNADQLVVFDTAHRTVVSNLDGFPRVHGVLAVPSLGLVFASSTGEHKLAAIDMATLRITSKSGPVNYPDGIAYAPNAKRIFVSDEHGDADVVFDATTNAFITAIPLGGGAGNTVYDPTSGHILVAVHSKNQLVAIDPATATIIGRYPLPTLSNPHGIAIDPASNLAFIVGEDNHKLALFSLATMQTLATYNVGDDPDVLAFDPGLKILYVSAESGNVTVFHLDGKSLTPLGSLSMPYAHTVAVDPDTHLVYFPLQNINGHPLLRIMQPTITH
jgi:DNA-binding beta-propeller fold protein YncE